MKFSAAILALAALVVCSCSGKAVPDSAPAAGGPHAIRVYSVEKKGYIMSEASLLHELRSA